MNCSYELLINHESPLRGLFTPPIHASYSRLLFTPPIHRCEAGVQLTLHAYTTSTGDVTAHDLALAAEIEQLCERPFVRQQL